MIPGDERKSMSILERISDEPRDARPYVDYAIADLVGKRPQWSEDPQAACTCGSVVAYIDIAIGHLEDLARKMDRETKERRNATRL